MSKQEIIVAEPVRTAIGAFNGLSRHGGERAWGNCHCRSCAASRSSAGQRAVRDNGQCCAGRKPHEPGTSSSSWWRHSCCHPGVDRQSRLCSGAQAIVTAAQEILSGSVDLAIAGGMENMDRAPYLLDQGRWGYRMGAAEIHDSMLRDGLVDAFSGEHSGWHTEDLVAKAQLTRERQDRWAERSQTRFSAAQASGQFDAEIVR